MSHQYMHINITGPVGAGKTCALWLIGHHLRSLGFNVTCYDAPLPYSSKAPEPVEPVDFTHVFEERPPQPWPVLVTVEGGGIEQLPQVGIGHNALGEAYRRVVEGSLQGAQVSEQPSLVECIDDVVASLRASLDMALRYKQTAHGVSIAEGGTNGGAVPLHQQ